MFLLSLWYFCSTFIKVDTFHIQLPVKTSYSTIFKMSMFNYNEMQGEKFINIYKNFLQNENINDLFLKIKENKIQDIFISNDYKNAVSFDTSTVTSSITSTNEIIQNIDNIHITPNINPVFITKLIDKCIELNIPVHFFHLNDNGLIAKNIFQFITTYGVSFFILLAFTRIIANIQNGGGIGGFGDGTGGGGGSNNGVPGFNPFFQMSKLKKKGKKEFEIPKLNFTDWIGSDEILEEVKEIVSYSKDKKLYDDLGVEMPRGILLEGPPGTGKTLLAKAIAGETNSSFMSISASEFVELYVGLGASRVRSLFANARKNRPSIIFIDEIDAIGKKRGNNPFNNNDEREGTLNALLYEMDGFESNEDILIIGATNRKDVLDDALMRPGRFDRVLSVPLPDKNSRSKILEFYLRNKKLNETIEIQSLAELTTGFSGADLKNLVNEAAIFTARKNNTVINNDDVFNAFEKSIVGIVKRNSTFCENTRKRIAIHEAGHALLALNFSNYFDLQKISIQQTYNGAGGYTIFTEKPNILESGLYTKDILKKRLMIVFGGKAAENIIYGDDYTSLGAIDDLKKANQLAKQMIGNFGFGSEKLEVFYNNDDEHNTHSRNSDLTKINFDNEYLKILNEAYTETKNILRDQIDKLEFLAELLVDKTFLYKKDLPFE